MVRDGLERLLVTTSAGSYPCIVGEGILGDVARRAREVHGQGRFFVVSDEHVAPLYGEAVAEALGAPLLALPPGEEHKNLRQVERVVHFLVRHGVERQDAVVAVGGGVVTDVAGFAASITLRGVAWLAVPTTVVGMVDAAVGGKTGVDLELGKNLVGTFWHPRAVLADPLTLATLPPRQVRAGLVEVVKAAVIAPSTLQHLLEEHLPRLAVGPGLPPTSLLAAAVKVKAEVVSLDEREAGPRAALNLGHTLGHALEAATGFRHFLHGEAVGWGLLAALYLARERGLLATTEALRWARLLDALRPWPSLAAVRFDELKPFLGRDKKRQGGSCRWVLPRLGGVVVGVEVREEEVRQAFEKLQSVKEAAAELFL